jgi:hypothetical protein
MPGEFIRACQKDGEKVSANFTGERVVCCFIDNAIYFGGALAAVFSIVRIDPTINVVWIIPRGTKGVSKLRNFPNSQIMWVPPLLMDPVIYKSTRKTSSLIRDPTPTMLAAFAIPVEHMIYVQADLVVNLSEEGDELGEMLLNDNVFFSDSIINDDFAPSAPTYHEVFGKLFSCNRDVMTAARTMGPMMFEENQLKMNSGFDEYFLTNLVTEVGLKVKVLSDWISVNKDELKGAIAYTNAKPWDDRFQFEDTKVWHDMFGRALFYTLKGEIDVHNFRS